MRTLKYLDEIGMALTHLEKAAEQMRKLQKEAHDSGNYPSASYFAYNAKCIEEIIVGDEDEGTGFRSFCAQEVDEIGND